MEELLRLLKNQYSKHTVYRWIQREDMPYIKIKGKWKYLYRALDKYGRTIDFMLSHKRDITAAKRFFKKVLKQCKHMPSNITTDKCAL